MLSVPKCVAVLAFVLAVVSAGYAAPRNRITQQIDDSQMTRLRGNVHPQANVRNDRGQVSPGLAIQGASLLFRLSPAQQADLDTLLEQQRDPASPNYHQWLTPEEYADRFGMSQEDIAKAVAWLQAKGLSVNSVSRSRTRIHFSGTAAQVGAAFRTSIHQYLVNGRMHFANATDPAIPSALASVVVGVRNLNNFRPKPRKVQTRTMPAPRYTSSSGGHFLSPDDFATIYNVQPLYDAGIDGTNQAVVVAGQTQIDPNDINAFRSASGLSNNPPQSVLVPNSGTSTVVDDDVLEADLDVEWTGAVAREAKVFYVYTGNSTTLNVINAMEYAVDQNIAPVISISYGLCEASASSTDSDGLRQLAQEANSHGQTIAAASGDAGAADCDSPDSSSASHGLAVDLPGSIPEVTSVGGTEFSGDVSDATTYWSPVNLNGNGASALKYIPETSWNDSAETGDLSSGGGGVSALFDKPGFQTALTPHDSKRDVPDISFNASAHHDGYLVCSQGKCVNGFVNSDNTILLVGGTSVGAPVFSGLVTLMNQATQSRGQQNVNEIMYSLAASSTTAFHDVTTGNNKVKCTSGSTGCTSDNSHVVVGERRGLGLFGGTGILALSLVGAWIPSRRRRWLALPGLVALAVLATAVGCGGGGGGGSTPPPTPSDVSIGFSAGTGYDLATGLGSLDANAFVNLLPGFTAPGNVAFTVSSNPGSITATAGQPGTSTLTITRNTLTGTVNLSCKVFPLNSSTSCSVSPSSVALSGATPSPTATLTVTASPAGGRTAVVQANSGNIYQRANVPMTAQ